MRILFADGTGWAVDEPRAGHGGVAGGVADGALLAPMPGKIIAVDVAEGDHVTKGQRLLVMGAMKMEQAIITPFDGRVARLAPSVADPVSEGTLLASMTGEGDSIGK